MTEGDALPTAAPDNGRPDSGGVDDSDLYTNDRIQLARELDHYRLLRGALGPAIAGGLAGVGTAGLRTWSPSKEEAQRIATAASVWVTVSHADGDATARAWFIGSNPWLGGESPVEALMSGRLEDVRTAAAAFEQDAWSG